MSFAVVRDISTELIVETVVAGLSRRLRRIISDPALNPWRRPILRRLRRREYGGELPSLGLRTIVPRQNWIEMMSKADPEFLLFEATVPNLNEREWCECFRRRFLPSWAHWKKSSSWRAAFHKYVQGESLLVSGTIISIFDSRILYRVWHRTHSSCTTDEAWTRLVTGFHPTFIV